MATRELKRPKKELALENRAIGQRLRLAREALDMSQRKVAAALHENQSWVSKVEKGERRADLAEGARMIRLYKADPWAILLPDLTPFYGALAADKPTGQKRGGKVVRPKYKVTKRRSKPARSAKRRGKR